MNRAFYRQMLFPPEATIDDDTLELVLPMPTPSLNQFSYSHWRTQYRAKRDWLMMIRASLVGFSWQKETRKRRLEIHRYGKRALDIDNLIGGAKMVITDNLRKLELLCDDSPQLLELHAENHKLTKGEAPHTVVLVTTPKWDHCENRNR